ncbi:MAG: conjugal transfer protein TraX [Lachnospiraceae bacterium]|nr:conjugal transfer protein TraX [Lachnospiraceae bacterium]
MAEEVLKGRSFGISGSSLKIIAVISMFIDHAGAAFLGRMLVGFGSLPYILDNSIILKVMPWVLDWEKLVKAYYITRYIGRIAFPIYCFLLVEGFKHTHDVKKYVLRLGGFALISEIPFDLCFNACVIEFTYQNVFFTLFIGLITMLAADWSVKRRWASASAADWMFRCAAVSASVVLGTVAAELMSTDYGGTGVLCIMVLYFFRNRRVAQALAGAAVFSWEITAPLAFLPVLAYNGRRGLKLKYFFYMFYPAHLLLIYLVCKVMGTGDIRVF